MTMHLIAVAIERLDIWVLRFSIGFLLVCLAGVVVWHLAGGFLAGKLKKRKVFRLALEPPPSKLPVANAAPLVEKSRLARELLALARSAFGSRQFASCLDCCTVLIKNFPVLPEAADCLTIIS